MFRHRRRSASVLEKVLEKAEQEKTREDALYPPEARRGDIDWYIDWALRNLSTEEFATLFTNEISLIEFVAMRLSDGSTVRRALMHDLLLDAVLNKVY